MNNEYLKTWFANFPRLQYMLSPKDIEVLSRISPFDYIDHNLTKEAEVISIIEVHKPQAWKWLQMYPALKDLSDEEIEVLDKLCPTDFIYSPSEEDIRRVIRYKLNIKDKELSNIKSEEAKKYYKEHEEEIAKEEKYRNRLDKFTVLFSTLGVSIITAGITQWNTGVGPWLPIALGATTILGTWVFTSKSLIKVNKNSVIPRSPIGDVKLSFFDVSFIATYWIGLVGMGIILGSLPAWIAQGWGVARYIISTGVIVSGTTIILLIITAIIAHILE